MIVMEGAISRQLSALSLSPISQNRDVLRLYGQHKEKSTGLSGACASSSFDADCGTGFFLMADG
jgi:hypothetical protein